MLDAIPTQRPLTPLLDAIDDPTKLRELEVDQLDGLARELREFLLYSVGKTGGHFGAGLGVVELTIAPGGEVIRVNILSSELGDEALERKLVLKIKRFKFSKANVAEITVTYPIDFVPS